MTDRQAMAFAWDHRQQGHRYEVSGDEGMRSVACECGEEYVPDTTLAPILRAARQSVEYHDTPSREYPGYIWIEWEDLVRFVRAWSPRVVECPWCRGVGRVNGEPCHPCREDGSIAEGDDHWNAALELIERQPDGD